MSVNNTNKGKHLSLESRITIEIALSEKLPLDEIAKRLDKYPTAISTSIVRGRVPNSS